MPITYLMTREKALLRTTNSRIYQNENCVDEIQFFFPKEYEGQALKDFKFTLSWVDPNAIAHADVLVLKDDDYKGAYLKFAVPVTTKLTKIAGFVSFKINVVKINADYSEEQILKTGSNSLKILSNNDFETTKDEMLSAIKSIQQAVAVLEVENAIKADNFKIVNNGNAIQLLSNDLPVGDPILLTDLFKAQEKVMEDETFKINEY